jgi:hypothetical protein
LTLGNRYRFHGRRALLRAAGTRHQRSNGKKKYEDVAIIGHLFHLFVLLWQCFVDRQYINRFVYDDAPA